jgi:ankyrin repeat protein
MLLEEGADDSLVSAYNETALLLAEENGHEDVVALL